MAKAAASAVTEGPVKGAVKGKGVTARPAPPPAPKSKKVTPSLSALFEAAEPAPKAKKVTATPSAPLKAKKVTAPPPAPLKATKVVVPKVVEPTPAKPPAKATKKVAPEPVPVTPPAKLIKLPSKKPAKPAMIPEDATAAEAGLVTADAIPAAKRAAMTKEEIAIETLWAKVFNSYLKRDLKQLTATSASLNQK